MSRKCLYIISTLLSGIRILSLLGIIEDGEYRASVSLSIQCGRNVDYLENDLHLLLNCGSALDLPWHWAHRGTGLYAACQSCPMLARGCPMVPHDGSLSAASPVGNWTRAVRKGARPWGQNKL